MRIAAHDPWPASAAEAIALQKRLAPRVVLEGDPPEQEVRLVAGCDLAFVGRGRRGDTAVAAVVLLAYPDLTAVERHVIEAPVTFPYVPGLLAFRELPALLGAFERLERAPDLVVVDGQGYAHPRRFGIACHLGLLLDLPTIGCAKSRLIGEHDEPAVEAGSSAELRHDGELVGYVVRTRERGRPLYVSPGHRVGFAAAARWVLRLSRGYRLPEPTRLADRLAAGRPLSV
jgi:deoxyribonuclease V